MTAEQSNPPAKKRFTLRLPSGGMQRWECGDFIVEQGTVIVHLGCPISSIAQNGLEMEVPHFLRVPQHHVIWPLPGTHLIWEPKEKETT